MEERYSYSNSVWRSLRNGDFQEEDVWAVFKETKDSTPKAAAKSRDFPVSVPRPLPSTAARMIPRTSSSSTTTTTDNNNYMSHEVKVVQQSSAPVNIPDWSKIYGKKSKNKASKNCHHASWLDVDDGDEEDSDDEENEYDNEDDDDEEDEDHESGHKMPPHEFIARRLERSQISSFSVFEGVGRTLKGRDLSKVRNAVLTKTGFLESL